MTQTHRRTLALAIIAVMPFAAYFLAFFLKSRPMTGVLIGLIIGHVAGKVAAKVLWPDFPRRDKTPASLR